MQFRLAQQVRIISSVFLILLTSSAHSASDAAKEAAKKEMLVTLQIISTAYLCDLLVAPTKQSSLISRSVDLQRTVNYIFDVKDSDLFEYGEEEALNKRLFNSLYSWVQHAPRSEQFKTCRLVGRKLFVDFFNEGIGFPPKEEAEPLVALLTKRSGLIAACEDYLSSDETESATIARRKDEVQFRQRFGNYPHLVIGVDDYVRLDGEGYYSARAAIAQVEDRENRTKFCRRELNLH
jgi:hypothetical protein